MSFALIQAREDLALRIAQFVCRERLSDPRSSSTLIDALISAAEAKGRAEERERCGDYRNAVEQTFDALTQDQRIRFAAMVLDDHCFLEEADRLRALSSPTTEERNDDRS